MRHRDAIEYLPEHGSRSLDPVTEEELLLHAEHCEECKGWLLTRDFLASAYGPGHEHHAEHPVSDLLALCVIRPEEVHEPDRKEVRLHLEQCGTCRHELDLARLAVLHGRPSAEAPRGRSVHPPPSRLLSRTGRAIAAGLAVVLLGAGFFIGGVLVGRIDSAGSRVGEQPGVSNGLDSTEELSGRDLDGTQILGAEGRLVVSKLTVRSGADITFQAGESVAFGDGFRVLSGARLRVASTGPDPGKTPTKTDEAPASRRGEPEQDGGRPEAQ